MDPKIWGPHAWFFLHAVTLAYPNNPTYEEKENMLNFFNNLGNILPCDKCKIHFYTNIKKYKLTDDILSSKKSLVKWLIDIHNEVNKMTNKKVVSYDDAINNYTNISSNNSNKKIIIMVIIVIIVILGGIIYINK